MKDYDWKKKAAEGAEDMDERMERAFMSQAYSVVETKAGPLSSDPYRIGFEVVYRNDENTRMVGMFAFKIGDELLYAPVFFLHGEVKGTDCLHRSSTKTVVPLTKEWARFLIEKNRKSVEGQGISRSEAARLPAGIPFKRLAMPPAYKKASTELFEELLADVPDDQFFKAAAGAVLQDFITTDGGFKATSFLASAVEADPEFAEKLAFTLEPEQYAPALKTIGATKQAAVAEPTSLDIFTGMPPKDASEAETEAFFKAGFAIRDSRSDLSDVLTDDSSGEYSGVNDPGIYTIPNLDGKGVDRVLVGFEADRDEMVRRLENDSGRGGCPEACCDGSSPTKYYRTVSLVDGATGSFSVSVHRDNVPAGTFVGGMESTELCTDPTVGEHCVIVDTATNKVCSQVLLPTSISTGSDGTRTIKFNSSDKDNNYELVQYLASDTGFTSPAYCGNKVRFVKAAVMPTTNSSWRRFDTMSRTYPNSSKLIGQLIETGTAKRAYVIRNFAGNMHIGTPGSNVISEELSPDGMKIALAAELNMSIDNAELIVKEAMGPDRRSKFVLMSTKQAFDNAPFMMDDPQFQDDYDSFFGVNAGTPEQHQIAVQHPVNEVPDQEMGDGWDPAYADGMPADAIIGTAPADLAGLAKQMGAPNVFEKSVLGGLLTAYDSPAMFDKYLPKIEESVDALGRMVFLLYWKPGALQDIYGADDMKDMEDEILSNFKSQGDLLLKLLKKSAQLKRQD